MNLTLLMIRFVFSPRGPGAFKGVWDAMYASRPGFWGTYVMTVIYRYLDCKDLHMGVARVRCETLVRIFMSEYKQKLGPRFY